MAPRKTFLSRNHSVRDKLLVEVQRTKAKKLECSPQPRGRGKESGQAEQCLHTARITQWWQPIILWHYWCLHRKDTVRRIWQIAWIKAEETISTLDSTAKKQPAFQLSHPVSRQCRSLCWPPAVLQSHVFIPLGLAHNKPKVKPLGVF